MPCSDVAACLAFLGSECIQSSMVENAHPSLREYVKLLTDRCSRLWDVGTQTSVSALLPLLEQGSSSFTFRAMLDELHIPNPTTFTFLSAEEWSLKGGGDGAAEESTLHIMLSVCRKSANMEPQPSDKRHFDIAHRAMGGGGSPGVLQMELDLTPPSPTRTTSTVVQDRMATVVEWSQRLEAFPEVVILEVNAS